ncbi:MAG: non-heme iron oxygenase ferredoxin subunit [Leptospiraceae bacterium]|nr:non-heme iron oxygenase ferredoxin subunit [Leptospiraceae bacterium]
MFKKLAKVSQVLEGKVLSIETRYVRVGLTKLNGEILAFEDACSHDGEVISEGQLENGCIICPRHLAKFDLKTGNPLCMPATEPIAIFEVRINGEDVEVNLED